MSAIIARLSTPLPLALIHRGATFSTAASTRSQSSGWWSNLQPSTRRNVKVGLGIAALADIVTLEYYFYPEMFGSKKE